MKSFCKYWSLLTLSLLFSVTVSSTELGEVNTARSILESCKKKYDDENKSFKDSLFKSQRGIFEEVIKNGFECDPRKVVPIANEELEGFIESVTDVGRSLKDVNLLTDVTDEALGDSLEAMISQHALYHDEEILTNLARQKFFMKDLFRKHPELKKNRTQFNRAFKDAIAKNKKKGVKKVTPKKVEQTFTGFGQEINKLCKEMRNMTTTSGALSSKQTRRGRRTRTNEKLFKQVKAQSKQKMEAAMFKLSQENSDIAPLLYTDTYRDEFPLDDDMIEDCMKGRELDPVDIADVSKSGISGDAIEEIGEILHDDLEQTEDALEALRTGDVDDINDEVHNVLKYKPYLAGQFLKDQSGSEQEQYAKYLCKETLEIYDTDELWNIGYFVGGLAVGAIVGVLVPGVGLSVAATLAAGVATAGTEIAIEYKDGQAILNGAQVGAINDKIDHDSFLNREEKKKDKDLQALVTAGGTALGAVAGKAFKGAKAFANSNRASSGTTTNAVRAGASQIADDVIAATDDVGDSVGRTLAQEASNSGSEVSANVNNAILKEQVPGKTFSDVQIRAVLDKVEIPPPLDAVPTRRLKSITGEAIANSKLTDPQRLALIQKEFPNLTPAQRKAILEAHNNPKLKCPIGQCHPDQIRAKSELMQAAGIDENTARAMINKGIAGDPPTNALASAASEVNSTKFSGIISDPSLDSPYNSIHKMKNAKLDPASPHKVWFENLQSTISHSDNMKSVKMKIEVTDAQGNKSIKEIEGSIHGTSADGKQLSFWPSGDDSGLNMQYIDLENPNMRVLSVSEMKPTYVQESGTVLGTKYNDWAEVPIYNSDAQDALNKITSTTKVKEIKVEYTGEYYDGYGDAYSTMQGKLVKKDGKLFVKSNKDGREYPIDKDLGNIRTKVVYEQKTFEYQEGFKRENQVSRLRDTFDNGTPVRVQREGKPDVQGDFLGIVEEKVPGTKFRDGYTQRMVVIRTPSGELDYVLEQDLSRISTMETEKMLYETPVDQQIKLKSYDED